MSEQTVLGWTRDAKGNVIDWHEVEIANAVTSAKRDNTQNYVQRSDVRISKLTERECFRLMDVDDETIDKIQAAGISRTAQYHLAGNSICVGVLYHVFDRLFIHTEPTDRQLSLF